MTLMEHFCGGGGARVRQRHQALTRLFSSRVLQLFGSWYGQNSVPIRSTESESFVITGHCITPCVGFLIKASSIPWPSIWSANCYEFSSPQMPRRTWGVSSCQAGEGGCQMLGLWASCPVTTFHHTLAGMSMHLSHCDNC